MGKEECFLELRDIQEEIEMKNLSDFATKSRFTKGRVSKEDRCDMRTDFQRDRDRIIHCKAFRRLKHKTQVFISPEGDHYRDRLTHTLEVSQIARTISRALRLNEDLTEAIALGHDLGHTPFGHAGEKVLDRLSNNGFEHSKQSLRVVERLEKDGKGLNLTYEVRDGILNHRTKGTPHTMEGKVVQLSDKIAYINHDIDDAIRAGILSAKDIPNDITEVIGTTGSSRIDSMVRNVVANSEGKNDILVSADMKRLMADLRKFMFAKVYTDERSEIEGFKVENMIESLYDFFIKNYHIMKKEFLNLIDEGEALETVVCDYIACMTDRYSISIYKKYFIPSSWNIY